MKKNITRFTSLAAVLIISLATPILATAKDKEVTITGEGKCAKCALKETTECQGVIQVEEKGKTVNYYLAKNDVSNDFHSNICKETKKVTATGTVKKIDGKKELTATKIELAQ